MNKKEFLEQFEDALAGEVDNSIVYDNKQYYSKYIDSELWKGREEEEILQELGSPRLLAKTIIDLQGGGAFSGTRETAYENYRTVGDEPKTEAKPKKIQLDGNITGILVGLVGLAVIFFVVWCISGVIAFIIRYAWPVLLVLLLWFITKHYLKRNE